MAGKGEVCMRKYTLANGQKRGVVDLRDYEDVISKCCVGVCP